MWVYLCGILLLAGLIRFSRLGQEGLWTDELYTVQVATYSVADLLEALSHDRHPPLHHILVKAFLSLHDSDAMARMPSALAGWLTCALLYLIGRRLGSEALGLLSALLAAASPPLVLSSVEARSFALHAFESVLGFYGMLLVLRQPSRLRGWWTYGTASVAQLYTYYFGFFTVAAMSFILMVRAWTRSPQLRKPWMVTHCVLLAALLPLGLYMHRQFGAEAMARVQQNLISDPSPPLGRILAEDTSAVVGPVWTLRAYGAMRSFPVRPYQVVLALLLLGAGTVRLLWRRGPSSLAWALPAVLAVAFAMTFCATASREPRLLQARYLAALGALSVPVVAAALLSTGRIGIVGCLLGLLMYFDVPLSISLNVTPRDGSKLAAQLVRDETRPGDVLIYSCRAQRRLLSRYFERPEVQLAPSLRRPVPPGPGELTDLFLLLEPKHLAPLRGHLEGVQRVWSVGRNDSRREIDIIGRWLESQGFELEWEETVLGLPLARYERVGDGSVPSDRITTYETRPLGR